MTTELYRTETHVGVTVVTTRTVAEGSTTMYREVFSTFVEPNEHGFRVFTHAAEADRKLIEDPDFIHDPMLPGLMLAQYFHATLVAEAYIRHGFSRVTAFDEHKPESLCVS